MQTPVYTCTRVLASGWKDLLRRDGVLVRAGRGPFDGEFSVSGETSKIAFHQQGESFEFDLMDVRSPLRERLEKAFLASGARCDLHVFGISDLYLTRTKPSFEGVVTAERRGLDAHAAADAEPYLVGEDRRVKVETGPALGPGGERAWFVHLAPRLSFLEKIKEDQRSLLASLGSELRARGAVQLTPSSKS